jgi:hypothetical protein
MKRPKIVFDVTTITAQLEKMERHLAECFPDGHPSIDMALWNGIVVEAVFSDSGIHVGEDGSVESIIQVRLGPRFDFLLSAFGVKDGSAAASSLVQ